MSKFKRAKTTIKSTVLGGAAAAVLVSSPVALAHGYNHNNGDDSRNRTTTASRQSQSTSNRDSNYWNWRNRHHRDMQKSCAERQAQLNQQAATTKDRDTKKLNGLNIVLSGTQTYVTTGGVAVENYDALNATATTSQTNATAAVNAIVAPTLNCDDENASDTNRAAVVDFSNKLRTADQSLNTYRHDVFTLFNAAINS